MCFTRTKSSRASTTSRRASPEILLGQFALFESEAKRLMEAQLALPAYEMVLKCSHTFNLLDAARHQRNGARRIHRPHPQSGARRRRELRSRERLGFSMAGMAANREARMMGRASLLVELQTEELPPKALKSLATAFASGIEAGLYARHFLTPDSRVSAFGTPRRLAVHITNVAVRSADQPFKQKLMPLAVARDAAKNWTQAFLKKLEGTGREHLARIPLGKNEGPDTLVVEHDGKADSIFLHGVTAGQPLHLALQAALDDTLAGLPIPKMMSYQLADGQTTVQFVRPATDWSRSTATPSCRSMRSGSPPALARSVIASCVG